MRQNDTPQGHWITPACEMNDVCPVFHKVWAAEKPVQQATLTVTALGVYEARLNGQRVSAYVLAPGWTAYHKRLQYQVYDITPLLTGGENTLTVTVGRGWCRSPMPGWVESPEKAARVAIPAGLLAEIRLVYTDGTTRSLGSDESWNCAESAVRFSEIYDGEQYDARFAPSRWQKAALLDWPTDILIPQEGEEIREHERLAARRIFTTPAGETVVDFGQEVTGYVELCLTAHAGDEIRILHGEMLDAQGNFYNANYRTAKAELRYICKEGAQTWHPALTFFGFRYLKLAEYPVEPKPEQFTAIAVYSDLRRTGTLECANPKLNRLFSNILWGQRDNFLDVPTDCPQRDERLGWTGDAQVFVKTASYNYDVERFFRKWLRDLKADQRPDGAVGQVVPDYLPQEQESAAWGDAAVICPWQIYLTYGDPAVLAEQFDSMKAWVDCITAKTTTPGLWTGGQHFGDWLGLDAPSGSYKGASREDLIATAFYAHSTALLVKAGRVLGRDMSDYAALHRQIVHAFQAAFPTFETQTELVLAIRFGLTDEPQKLADALAEKIVQNGSRMATGFVGTPYLLHVLSDYGHTDLAYTLLLREGYPSWLYPISKGATTVWEHWDSVMEDGSFWSTDMNSFNHYAYGAVADWVYEQAAGIRPVEEAPGFAQVIIEPKPDPRLPWLQAAIQTRHGLVRTRWEYTGAQIRFEVHAEMPFTFVLDGKRQSCTPGDYLFWGAAEKEPLR